LLSDVNIARRPTKMVGVRPRPVNRPSNAGRKHWADRVFVSVSSLARYRFHCGSICRQGGNLGKRDRLHRRPHAKITDFSARQSVRFRHEVGTREATKTPLESHHAATQERLHLVRAGTPKRHGFENLPSSNFLAATHQDVTAGAAEVRCWLIKAIEK